MKKGKRRRGPVFKEVKLYYIFKATHGDTNKEGNSVVVLHGCDGKEHAKLWLAIESVDGGERLTFDEVNDRIQLARTLSNEPCTEEGCDKGRDQGKGNFSSEFHGTSFSLPVDKNHRELLDEIMEE